MGPRLTPIVKYLLIANAIFFVLTEVISPSLKESFALYNIFYSNNFQPFQIFTHFFTHAGIGHIFFNMLMLFFFGPLLEQVWGSKRFLNFYLITGIGASVLFTAVATFEIASVEKGLNEFLNDPSPSTYRNFIVEDADGLMGPNEVQKSVSILRDYEQYPNNPIAEANATNFSEYIFNHYKNTYSCVGASGAIFGILMAFMLLFPNTELYLYFLFPVKAKYLVPALALIELYSGLSRAPDDNVAHFAHLGGMLFGFILVKIWNRKSDKFY